MKYALIGCGRIAINHIKASRNNGLELAALCDIETDQIDILLGKVQLKTDVPRYTDYKKMIRNHPELELVAIATDSGMHAEIALFSIDHGLHVNVEKPMAMSMADATEMIRRSEEKGVKLSVCHQNRFNLAVREMREALEKGRFGKISHGSVHVRWNRNKEYYQQAPWRGKWASDGGSLMNQCIHGVDLLRWMMGDEVEEVYGATRQRFHDYLECEDIGMAVLKFKSGAIGTVEGTVNVFPENLEETLYLFGETGTVKLGGKSCNSIDVWNFADEVTGDSSRSGLREETSNVYGNGHTSLYADVIDSIRNHRRPLVDAYAGRNALEIILAVYKSQLTGQSVKLPLKEFSSMELEGMFGEAGI